MPLAAVAAVVGAAGVASGVIAIATIAEIGIAMSVVGTLTKSSELSQIGMGLGLAGAGAGLMASAGEAAVDSAMVSELGADSLAEGAEAATGAGEALGGAGGTAGQAGDYGLNALQNADQLTPQLTNLTEAGADVGQASLASDASGNGLNNLADQPLQTTGTPAPNAPAPLEAPTPQAPAATAVDAPVGPSAPSAPEAPQAPSVGSDPYNAAQDSQAYNNTLPNNGAPDDSFFSKSKDYFDKISTWAENHKTVANGALQLGGSLLKGMAQSKIADRQYQIDADKLALQQQQLANYSSVPRHNASFGNSIIGKAKGP